MFAGVNGLCDRKLFATESKRALGMMLSGNGSEVHDPLASWRMVLPAASKKLKLPFSMSGLGTSPMKVSDAFSWCRAKPNNQNVLSLPLYSFGIRIGPLNTADSS